MNTIRLNTIGDSPIIIKKGSQVQSQEKTVEITENGTTEVVPDSGFFALKKVNLNVNVQGGGGGDNLEYLDITSVTDGKDRIILYSTLAKTPIGIMPSAGLIEMVLNMGLENIFNALNYIAMSPTLEVTLNGQPQTISSCIEGYDSIPRITKEEFYAL